MFGAGLSFIFYMVLFIDFGGWARNIIIYLLGLGGKGLGFRV